MTENDLTDTLKAMLIFIEGHIAKEIPDSATFDPYGILFKQESGGMQMVFLEAMDDSGHVLKGLPGPQIGRRVEEMIRRYRYDNSVVSAGLLIDAHLRLLEGGEKGDAVIAWLDDRGKQQVRVVISYDLCGREFRITSKTIEKREELFLSGKEKKG